MVGAQQLGLVVFALGSLPQTALAQAAGLTLGSLGGIAVNDQMQTSDPDIYAGGDAVECREFVSGKSTYIPLAGPANRQGRMIADNLCGRESRYRGTQGTSVLQVFDLTVALTGLNEKALRKAGLPYRKVYLSPMGHAGYYPGSAPMRCKLLFSPDGNRILGAQIVGRDGVDKRIDVLATAMRANPVRFFQNRRCSSPRPLSASLAPPGNTRMCSFDAINCVQFSGVAGTTP